MTLQDLMPEISTTKPTKLQLQLITAVNIVVKIVKIAVTVNHRS